MADEEGDSISRGSIEVCRIMVPDDANIAGNVHGGTTLKLIEEAGYIIATRHCNKAKSVNTQYNAALVRVERTDFLQPVYIGEVVQVHADLGYASKHSLEVKVSVWAENLMTGERRLTNRAALWYVPVDVKRSFAENETIIGDVPPVDGLSEIELEKGKARYEYQKRARVEKQEQLKKLPCNCVNHSSSSHSKEVPTHSVLASQSSFIHFVQPSECSQHGYLNGGVIMKMMDDLAGTIAYRHCKTNVVTASIDAIDFHESVKVGHIVNLFGMLTFTSSRSMEIKVIVDAEDLVKGNCYRACSAFFTFVSLDGNHRPQAIQALQITTEEEKQRFEEGKKRYEERKQRRLSHN